ncbi:hypothetical protein ABZP36_020725 [Zizania latifolia]
MVVIVAGEPRNVDDEATAIASEEEEGREVRVRAYHGGSRRTRLSTLFDSSPIATATVPHARLPLRAVPKPRGHGGTPS